MQTTYRHFLTLILGAMLAAPASLFAQNENAVTSQEEPFIILGPYQIFLNSQTQLPSLDEKMAGGETPIIAADGKEFWVLDLTFKNTGKETYMEVQLTLAFKSPDGTPLAMAPYATQPQGTIKDKAPAPGESISGKLIFELPQGSSDVSLTAIGLKADKTLTPPVTRLVAGKNY